MPRHIVDKSRGQADTDRLRHYTGIERTTGAEGAHPSAKALHRQPGRTAGSRRLEKFTLIDRGRRA